MKATVRRRHSATCTSRKVSAVNHIQKLPFEIIATIFKLLSDPNKVCFMLSCKYFCCIYQSLPPQDKVWFFKGRSFRSCPSVELLHQLQNECWQFFRLCWKLHPYSLQRFLRSNWGLRQKRHYPASQLQGKTKQLQQWLGSTLWG